MKACGFCCFVGFFLMEASESFAAAEAIETDGAEI